MKIKFIAFLVMAFMAFPAMAEKPEWAGNKSRPTTRQKESHRADMRAKGGPEKYEQQEKIKYKKLNKEKNINGKKDQMKGLEKQQAKKSEQVQKELDKGSDKGKESREARKKWWKFWDE